MDASILLILAAPARPPSPLVSAVLAAARQIASTVEVAAEDGLLADEVSAMEQLGTALLAVIGPDVSRPFAVAQRLCKRHPELRFLFAVDPAQESALIRQATFNAPPGGRWRLVNAADSGLAAYMASELTVSGQQRRWRTTLDRMKLQLSLPAAVDSHEYRRLVVSDRYLASVLAHAHDGILSLDRDGYLQSWNGGAERLLGPMPPNTQRVKLSTFFDDVASTDAAVAAVRAGASQHIELVLNRANERLHVDARLDALTDDHGQLIGTVVILRDITDRHTAEALLKRSIQQKDEFLAMLAHELRNPLAPIRAASQLLQALGQHDPRAKLATEIIGRQVNHMAALINDLLDVARLTRGAVTLQLEPLHLDTLLADALEQVRPLMEAKQHRLIVSQDAGLPWMNGDRKRLTQALSNLLVNSAKYTSEGGEIHVRLFVDGGQAHIAIRDDGIGMSPELRARVFDTFSQGERSSDRAQGGLGIGLAIVRSIAELHGGCVRATSEGLGQGSEFLLSLPLPVHQPATVMPEDDPRSSLATNDKHRLRLMVVDDNADAGHTLGMLLEADGYEVQVQDDPRVALDEAAKGMPDVLILDIGMPYIDGHELARRIRTLQGGERPVLIAVTGYGAQKERDLSKQAGFDHHLVKPVDPGELVEALQQATARLHTRVA